MNAVRQKWLKEWQEACAELETENDKLRAEVERLRQRQAWIDQVARPDHPDDERPWCASYLDARAALKAAEAREAALVETLTWIRDNCDGPAHGKARAALEAARKGMT